MAAATSNLYAKAKSAWGDPSGTTPEIDWANDSFKACLVTSSYTPDYDNHTSYSQVSSSVLLSPIALSGTSWTKVGSGASAKYAAKSAALAFTGSVSARGMVIYKDTGTPATSPLLVYVLLDSAPADVSSSIGINVTPDSTNGWILVG